VLDRALEIREQVVRLRRDIHQHPELSFQETRTAALVADTLRSLGLRVKTGVGKTGVVGYLGEGSPVVALRADMDALPIQEANDVPYASCTPGVMHACGHDAHAAILLGVAMLLHDPNLPGQVRFLFQPAEESADEERKGGAERMIADGAMEGVDVVMSLHVASDVPTGYVEISVGPDSAAVDTFFATIIGQGCHGAYPHQGLDPIFIAAQVLNAIYGIIPRRIDPFQPAVISVCRIHAGTAENIIPQQVELAGTIRSMDAAVRKQLAEELAKVFTIPNALGGRSEFEIIKGVPPVCNDERVVSLLRQVATDLLGPDKLRPKTPGMGGEDFALMTEVASGAMFHLGVALGGEIRRGHSDTFDINEDALPIGVAILAEATRRYLIGEFKLG